jgi:hypothetical protein
MSRARSMRLHVRPSGNHSQVLIGERCTIDRDPAAAAAHNIHLEAGDLHAARPRVGAAPHPSRFAPNSLDIIVATKMVVVNSARRGAVLRFLHSPRY